MPDIVIDHNTNLDKIVELIKADKTLYDPAQGSKNFLRKVFKSGSDYNMDDDTTPYAYAKLADEYESTPEPFGTEFAGLNMSTATYEVTVVDRRQDVKRVQQKLIEFSEGIRRVLVANPTLDGLITRMNISKARRKDTPKDAEIDAYTFILGVVIGEEFSVIFPAPIGTVKLISWPLDRIEQTWDKSIDDDGISCYSPKADNDGVDLELEVNVARRTQFRDLIKAEDEIEITIDNGGALIVMTVLPVTFLKPVPFDQYQRAVLGCLVSNT